MSFTDAPMIERCVNKVNDLIDVVRTLKVFFLVVLLIEFGLILGLIAVAYKI